MSFAVAMLLTVSSALAGKLSASGNFSISVKSRAAADNLNTYYDIDVEIK